MKTLTKTIGLMIIATGIGGASALAVDVTKRGPLPFTAFDTNNDGTISEDEFDDVRGKRQAARAAEGGQMRNAQNAPEFEAIDTNKDGKIDKDEFVKGQALHSRRGQGRRMGRGQGRGQGKGMGRGRGQGQGQGRGMGRGRMTNQ